MMTSAVGTLISQRHSFVYTRRTTHQTSQRIAHECGPPAAKFTRDRFIDSMKCPHSGAAEGRTRARIRVRCRRRARARHKSARMYKIHASLLLQSAARAIVASTLLCPRMIEISNRNDRNGRTILIHRPQRPIQLVRCVCVLPLDSVAIVERSATFHRFWCSLAHCASAAGIGKCGAMLQTFLGARISIIHWH